MKRERTMPSRTARSSGWRAAVWGNMMVLGALLAGCGTAQPPRFHSLLPAPAAVAMSMTVPGPLVWEVSTVGIPPAVDQPQWVVRRADGSLAVLEQERWIAPLADELRAAVSERLTFILGAPMVDANGTPQRLWRVKIDVQRFESWPGREARLDALWSVRAVGGDAASLTCRVEIAEASVSDGYLGLAAAHRRVVGRLGVSIGSAIKALSAGQAVGCSG